MTPDLIWIFDLGVNFGIARAFSMKYTSLYQNQKDYISTAINKSKEASDYLNLFHEYDDQFALLSANIGNVNYEPIAKNALDAFTKKLISIDGRKAYILNLGVNLGVLEAFAQPNAVGQGVLDYDSINYGINNAKGSQIFDNARNEALFGFIKESKMINWERAVLAVRLTFAGELAPNKSGFRASSYSVRLTAVVGEELMGFGHRVATDVNDSLNVRALVLSDDNSKVAIASIDTVYVYDKNLARIKAKVKSLAGIEKILLVATHTHSAPDFQANGTSAYQLEREEQVVVAILSAAGRLRSAEIGVGGFESDEGFNRVIRNSNGTSASALCHSDVTYHFRDLYYQQRYMDPVNKYVVVVNVRSVDDSKSKIATLVNYAMHPVLFGGNSTLISSDYVGRLCKNIEEENDADETAADKKDKDVCCLFLQGAAGDIDPWYGTLISSKGDPKIAEVARNISNKVKETADNIKEYDKSPQLIFSKPCDFPIRSLDGVSPADVGNTAELNAFAIGRDLVITTFPGEVFTSLGDKLKLASPFKITLLVGYTNHSIGYLPSIEDWHGEDITSGAIGTIRPWVHTAKDTGENLINASLNMLKNLHNP